MTALLRFAALGMDHRHIYGMSEGMIAAGCELAGYWTEGEPQPLAGFQKALPGRPPIRRARPHPRGSFDPARTDRLCAPGPCPPGDRGDAPRQGRDARQTRLHHARRTRRTESHRRGNRPDLVGQLSPNASRSGRSRSPRKWSQKAASAASCRRSASGRTASTPICGPTGFSTRSRYGGILTDIGTHQIDQFLHFTSSTDARRSPIRRSAISPTRIIPASRTSAR